MPESIYALSTTFGKSGIAVFRTSGERSLYALKLLTGLDNPKARYSYLKNIINPFSGELVDQGIVVYFVQDASYTNEDMVEYQIHGSIAVIKEMLDIFSKIEGFRLANNGEFSQRALENNNLDLVQVQGVLDLIESETILQKQYALRQLSGNIESKYKSWYDRVFNNLSLIELCIDFSDQEIPDGLIANINQEIDDLISEINKSLVASSFSQSIRNGFKLCIIGHSNVGKSSLINILSNKDISIVSSISGTTRDIVSTYLDIKGYPVIISDTAGIVDTDDLIEQEGIKRTLNAINDADIKICVCDASDFENTYNTVKDFIDDNAILVVNKIDLNHNFKTPKEVTNYIKCSLINQKSIDDIYNAIYQKLQNTSSNIVDSYIFHDKHKRYVENALQELNLFLNSDDVVIKSYHLKQAMDLLGNIYGKIDIDDILDSIFSQFCIGK